VGERHTYLPQGKQILNLIFLNPDCEISRGSIQRYLRSCIVQSSADISFSLPMMRIACLTRYDALGASSRVRFIQYFAPLARIAPELSVTQQGLLDADYLQRKYARRTTIAAALRCYAQRAVCGELWAAPDLWWIEKELWPWVPALLERALLARRPYMLDLDDAIFHNYDLHRRSAVRHMYGRKIDELMAGAALVIAGNEYLAQRARRAGARWVEVLPTVVDLAHYTASGSKPAAPSDRPVTIGWIGSPATVSHLLGLERPFLELARRHRFRLLVIGGGEVNLPGVEVISVPWSEDTEATSVAQCDIGVMPLPDSPWERGKCGYKLIQYMACGLPVVASPVGANTTIVSEGLNGFLAADATDWYAALARLVSDPTLRARLGGAGRARVEADYCVQATAPRLANWLRILCNRTQ
jgi:glycosyltransferase involved in cell wall biosynthesis